MPRPNTTPLLLACVLAGVSLASPVRADDDRFVIRLGLMQANASTQLSGSANVLGQDYSYVSDEFDLGDQTVPRIEGVFRFSERNRLLFNYFDYAKNRRASLDEDVQLGDFVFPAGSSASTRVKFSLASLVYDYAIVETPTNSFGLQIGAEWAKLEGRVNAHAGADSFSARESRDGYAPVVGARWTTNTRDEKWRFVLQGQYLDAKWGDFGDYDGSITRANALAEYRFTPHFGFYGGYDWFKLDAKRSGRDGRIGLEQKFKGPTVGVAFTF